MTPERYQKIAEIYRAALELKPEERSAFLAEACRDNSALREEVESLLAYQDKSGTFIDRPAVELAAEALANEGPVAWIGEKINQYEIISLIGRGGMGEVYCARDKRLGRDVAFKVLPAAFSGDADRLRRFEQEAQAAGKLNHPNVLTVYAVDVHRGMPYIVTELLDGEDLRAQLNHGAVPVRRAIGYAQQIAQGLAAAHAKGIVHRDLKPENIFVSSDGRIKILDFGLAKLKPPQVVGSSIQTMPGPMTEPGVVMGTVGYMAPEQVRGQEIDARADIFALGVILHEMLSGTRPFSGASSVEVLNAILKEETPDLSEGNAKISPVLARVVGRCLEKNPEQRFQSASDLGFALDALLAASTSSTSRDRGRAATTPQTKLRLATILVVAALTVAAGIFGWSLYRTDYSLQNPLANAQFTLLTDFPGMESDAAISADGNAVAFLSDRDGPIDIWVGYVGAGQFNNLTKGRVLDIKNPEVRDLEISRDGSQIYFWMRQPGQVTGIWTVPTLGGALRPYLDGPESALSPDGKQIVYHTNADGDPMFVAAANERVGKQIYVGERGIHCHFQIWSPDGAYIYFVRGYPPSEMDIWRIRPNGGNPERITFVNAHIAYPVFLNERTLLYVARAEDGTGPWLYSMDVERRVPHRISFGVERYTSIAITADRRRLVATVANPEAGLWRLPISDGVLDDSAARHLSLPTVRGLSPRIGSEYMLYLSSKGGDDGIWKLADGTAVELWNASLGRVLEGPAISPDGRRIAFTARKSGRNRLYLMNADGTRLTELGTSLNIRGAPTWPPVGEWVTVLADNGKSTGLFKVPTDTGTPVQLFNGLAQNPVWSPDGSFLIYSDVETGTAFRLRGMTADGKPFAIPELVLSRGSNRFVFLPGRRELVVLKGEFWHKNFWLVDSVTGQQRQLTNFGREFLLGDFDISADGKEILFSRTKENSNIVLIDLPPQ